MRNTWSVQFVSLCSILMNPGPVALFTFYVVWLSWFPYLTYALSLWVFGTLELCFLWNCHSWKLVNMLLVWYDTDTTGLSDVLLYRFSCYLRLPNEDVKERKIDKVPFSSNRIGAYYLLGGRIWNKYSTSFYSNFQWHTYIGILLLVLVSEKKVGEEVNK